MNNSHMPEQLELPDSSPAHPPKDLEGQPLSAAGEGHTGGERGADQEEGDGPENPASKPQGTLRDQETNMESEGQPVQLPADAGELPATTDDEAELEREASLVRQGSGF